MEGNQKKAIVTITIGEKYWKMASHTHPLLKRYAEKCDAEFVVIDHNIMIDRFGRATYEKLQLHDLLKHYDRIAFIDTDILVAPDSPDVFKLTPEHKVGASTEETYSKSARDKRVTQEVLGDVTWHNVYFNCGMMVLSKAHRELVNPDAPGLLLWATGKFRSSHVNLLNDQPFFNHRVNKLGLEVEDLGYKFNHTRVITPTHRRFLSHFIHYAGPSGHRYGERVKQIEMDSKVLHNSLLLMLSRRIPAYRWIADRAHPAFFQRQMIKLRQGSERLLPLSREKKSAASDRGTAR